MNASQVLDLSFINSSIESSSDSPIQSPPGLIATLAAGQPVTLTMTFPPPLTALIPSTDAAFTTPSFSSSVAWEVLSDEPMIEGEDYLILSDGGLASPALTLVFKPPMKGEEARTVTVMATAVVKAVVRSQPAPPVPPLLPVPPSALLDEDRRSYDVLYSVSPIDEGVLDKLIQGLVDLLYVAVPQLIVNPGDVVAAQVALRKAPGQPQLVTSLLNEMPRVEIRGSIPLDNILNFILEPFRKVSSLIPSGNPLSKADDVTANIKKLLPSALTVPVRLDIRGQRLTTAYSPIGDKGPITFSRTPDESGDIQGFLPLGRWPLPFSIPNANVPKDVPNQDGIQWNIIYQNSDGGDLDYVEPTTTFGMLRNILFFPQIQALGLPPLPSGKATIEIKPYVKIDKDPTPFPGSGLQQILLEVTPLPLPEVLACFDNVLFVKNPGKAIVYVSRETGHFAGSLDELLLLLGNLSIVLNDLISILRTVPTDPHIPPIPQFTNLVYLNQSIKVMSDGLMRSMPDVEFVIVDSNVIEIQPYPSALVAIAPRPILLTAFNSKVTPPASSLLIVAPQSASHGPFYSSYIASLTNAAVWNASFDQVIVIPKGSTIAADNKFSFNQAITQIKFAQELSPS